MSHEVFVKNVFEKEQVMGFVYASTEVKNIYGGDEKYYMPFLVDTGATDSVIPGNKLENRLHY